MGCAMAALFVVCAHSAPFSAESPIGIFSPPVILQMSYHFLSPNTNEKQAINEKRESLYTLVWKANKIFSDFFFFILFFCWPLGKSILAGFPLFQGNKNPSILLMLSSSVGGSALGALPRWRRALPGALNFLLAESAVFCPDSSALGSLCKCSFQSSSFLPSAVPEVSAAV